MTTVTGLLLTAAFLASAWTALSADSAAVEWHVVPGPHDGSPPDGSAARPFRTLAEAVAALPAAPPKPLVVRLAEGKHRLASPIEISAAHTRGQLLVFDGGAKAVISGGRQLTGWQVRDGRWFHPWNEGPLRELFINGTRRTRSRFPAAGWLRIESALPDKRSGFTTWEDLPAAGPGTELLFLHEWSVSRVPVDSIKGRLLKTAAPLGFPMRHFVIDHYGPHPRYCLENDSAFLTEPGTWCHNPASRQLIYLPRSGERPERVVTEVPVAGKLLRVAGTTGAPVRGVEFRGISFELCRWDIPPGGYAGGQATKHVPRDRPATDAEPTKAWTFVPWAVEVEHAAAIVFRDCRFRKLGGGGVLLGPRTRECALLGCVVADVAGNGIGLGEGGERLAADGRPWWQATPDQAANGNRVAGCLVERCGNQFHGAVGIWAGLVQGCQITGNEVRQLPYSGISLGWKWNTDPTPCADNLLTGNHIHHVMQLLSDGGGIYTLGRQPGTVLSGNLIHDIPLNPGSSENNGIFHDAGSSGIVVENNLIHATSCSPLRFNQAGNLTVRNNRWALAPGTPPMQFRGTDPAGVEACNNATLTGAAAARAAAAWSSPRPM